ncbi:hypothetical protein DUNSADRAFT_6057 [Dunaliella salina]|uniref:Uncharacterized protein n=1 Tax=Dunaliella salina TaxID=3046 RepID=A0ABQ7GNY9_DUNSA|nr:hypothetical protein DUNSADRAFT_6057 [Dunaliella salina]|eukprot:KAF5836330.1 hypothetical protein DUNSADRAFT_6057 [Dunaliella salina]
MHVSLSRIAVPQPVFMRPCHVFRDTMVQAQSNRCTASWPPRPSVAGSVPIFVVCSSSPWALGGEGFARLCLGRDGFAACS